MTPCPHLVSRIMAVMETAFDPAFGEAWNRRQVSDALAMPTTHALVVDGEGRRLEGETKAGLSDNSAGFVLTRHAADEEELLLIAVRPEFRRKGLGIGLIDQLLKDAKSRGVARVFLEMREGNPAIHLYHKLGFKPIGHRPNYYRLTNGDQVDAITFGRII